MKYCVGVFAPSGVLKMPNQYKIETSFYDWCIVNNRYDLLDRWDYELNDKTPNMVSHRSKMLIYLKCPMKKHESEGYILHSFVREGLSSLFKCRRCNSFAQYLLDSYGENGIHMFWDYDENTIDPWLIPAAWNNKVWIKCQEKYYHGSYLVSCNKFTTDGTRCPYCRGKYKLRKLHKFDSLGHTHPEVLEIWSNKNDKSPYEYTPESSQKVWWKCPDEIHDDYLRSINNSNHICNFRCPSCSFSKGESKIADCLLSCNIEYVPQKKFDNLRGIHNGLLSYDFYLPKYNILIEYQGELHDRPVNFGKSDERADARFQRQKEHDKRKREYAKDNHIKLTEIWYYDFNNIENILQQEIIQ